MKLVFRLLAMLVVLPATYYFVFWVPLSFVPFLQQDIGRSIVSLLCAVGVGWYTWKSINGISEGLVSSIFLGAIMLGAIGFCGQGSSA